MYATCLLPLFKALRIQSLFMFVKNLFPALAEFFEIGKPERNMAFLGLLYRLLAIPDDSGCYIHVRDTGTTPLRDA
jgi:hypothetical protein